MPRVVAHGEPSDSTQRSTAFAALCMDGLDLAPVSATMFMITLFTFLSVSEKPRPYYHQDRRLMIDATSLFNRSGRCEVPIRFRHHHLLLRLMLKMRRHDLHSVCIEFILNLSVKL